MVLLRFFRLFNAVFPSNKTRYFFLFFSFLMLNALSTPLEGLSFGLVLLALTVLSEGAAMDYTHIPLLSSPSILSWLKDLDVQQLFVLFFLLAIFVQILRSGLGYAAQVVSTFFAGRFLTEAQKKVYSQILRLSFPCVSRYKAGDLMDHVNAPATLLPVVIDGLNTLVSSGLTICSLVGIMFYISSPLTLLAIVTFGFLALSQKWIIYRISHASEHLLEHLVEFNKHAVQSLHGLRAIHTFNRQEKVMQNTAITLGRIATASHKLSLWSKTIPFINEVMGIALVGGFLFLGQWMIHDEKRSVLAILLTFITMVYRLNGRLQAFLGGLSAIAGNWGRLLRFEEILNERDKQFVPGGGQKSVSFTKGIFFHSVSLKYPTVEEEAVKNLTFAIPKGSVVAFVGASGAGKSSIMDLLLRLYDPTDGFISVDETPLCSLDIGSWRDYLGVVSQDTFIFNDTIEENIRFGQLNASMEEIIHAAKMAGIHPFIASLSEGYQTVLGEKGYRLSGGEKQRIALARAFVRDSEIFILDEATSSLDTQSERFIQKALEKYRGQKTVIAVAHRLSTITNADQIFVLDKGSIVETGTHLELLARNGTYAKFWRIQSQAHERELAIVQ